MISQLIDLQYNIYASAWQILGKAKLPPYDDLYEQWPSSKYLNKFPRDSQIKLRHLSTTVRANCSQLDFDVGRQSSYFSV